MSTLTTQPSTPQPLKNMAYYSTSAESTSTSESPFTAFDSDSEPATPSPQRRQLQPQSVLKWRALQPRDTCDHALNRRILDTDRIMAWRAAQLEQPAPSDTNAKTADPPAAAESDPAQASSDDESEFVPAETSVLAGSLPVMQVREGRPCGRRFLDEASVLRFWESQRVENLGACGRWL
jgi:hypothetical protein